MNVLVTGAAGFIGSHLVDRILALGGLVTGVDNFDPFYSPHEKRLNLATALQSERFRLVDADIADHEDLARKLSSVKADILIHLAAKGGVRQSFADPEGYSRVNVLGTKTVLALVRRLGISRVVFGSSSSVYGNSARAPFAEETVCEEPASPYAATKRAGELLAEDHHRRHGGSVTSLRFFTVYGPRQRPDLVVRKFSSLMSRGLPVPLFGDGKTSRDYTWIDDIIDGLLASVARSAEGPGDYQVINLGTGQATEIGRIVDLLADALQVNPRIDRLPPQPGDLSKTEADISKARRLLKYVPKVGIEEGILRFVRWYRQ